MFKLKFLLFATIVKLDFYFLSGLLSQAIRKFLLITIKKLTFDSRYETLELSPDERADVDSAN